MKTYKIEKCTAQKVRLLFGLGIIESALLLAICFLAVLLLVSAFSLFSLLAAVSLVIGSFLALNFLEQKQLFKQFFDQALPLELVNDWNLDLNSPFVKAKNSSV